MLKLWHEYFSATEQEVRDVGGCLRQSMDDMAQSVKHLTQRMQAQLDDFKSREDSMIEMRDSYNKTLDLLKLS